jgi:phosphoglycerate dehydrogenase-like enzyme
LDDYQGASLQFADWSVVSEQVDVKVYREHFEEEDGVVQAVEDCEIVVIMRERTPFGASLLSRLPKLKLLITSGMRNASIDLAAAKAQGVTVCGTASGSEPPMELTWALIHGLARQVVVESDNVRNGRWQTTVGVDLHGKRIGIVGLGKIGSKVARVAQAFSMNVTAWSRNLTRERAEEAGVELAGSLEELLSASDFVTVHLVLSDRTRHLIGEEQLTRMKPSAFLINTSRAAIVEQKALVRALAEGWIRGAGVDVYEQEPLPSDDVFRTMPNVLALPHLGYVSENNYRGYFTQAVEDIQAYLAGEPIRMLK